MAATEAQLERLYRERAQEFRDAAATITGGRESAGDAVQDAFARALAERRQYRGTGTLEGWVWRIVLRSSLATHRRRRWPLARGDEQVPATEMVERAADPELADAVRALPERQRLFVFLHYYADLSYPQIAQACGVREGTVAAALSQARATLLETLDPELTRRA